MRGESTGYDQHCVSSLSTQSSVKMFEQICFNRYFEYQVASAFNKKLIKAPIYLSVGQEHIPAAISAASKNFNIFAQHRAHSYYMSFGGSPAALRDELLHLPTGYNRGMGGSASISCKEINMFGHSGLMGDQVPIAVGYALGSKRNTLAVAGDSSMEEDYAIAAMGYAATKKLPVLFICEDNNLSILTEVSTRRSWKIADVARSFNMHSVEITDDPWLIVQQVRKALDQLPAFINIHTCRNLWHSGTGVDGPPEWNRFNLIKETLQTIIADTDITDIELKQEHRAKELWAEQLQKQ